MNNMFENAYFGKPYKTRGEKRAIYWKEDEYSVSMIVEGENTIMLYHTDGTLLYPKNEEYDIICEWKKEINEEELDKLAEQSEQEQIHIAKQCEALGQCYGVDFKTGFKVGFHKSLE